MMALASESLPLDLQVGGRENQLKNCLLKP